MRSCRACWKVCTVACFATRRTAIEKGIHLKAQQSGAREHVRWKSFVQVQAIASTLIGGTALQALAAEARRFHGTDGWWLSQRRSLSFDAVLQSGWPIFRIFELVSIRGRSKNPRGAPMPM